MISQAAPKRREKLPKRSKDTKIIRIKNVASQYIMILTCTLILNRYPAWYDLSWRRQWGAERVTIHLLILTYQKSKQPVTKKNSIYYNQKVVRKEKALSIPFFTWYHFKGFSIYLISLKHWIFWTLTYCVYSYTYSFLSYLIAYILFCILTGSTAIELYCHHQVIMMIMNYVGAHWYNDWDHYILSMCWMVYN